MTAAAAAAVAALPLPLPLRLPVPLPLHPVANPVRVFVRGESKEHALFVMCVRVPMCENGEPRPSLVWALGDFRQRVLFPQKTEQTWCLRSYAAHAVTF